MKDPAMFPAFAGIGAEHLGGPPCPTVLAQLAPNERFIVAALRVWIEHDAQAPEFLHLLNFVSVDPAGASGRHVAADLDVFFGALAGHARRFFVYRHSDLQALALEEGAVLGVIASLQDRQRDLAFLIATTIVHSAGLGEILANGAELASTLADHGIVLPVRFSLDNVLNRFAAHCRRPRNQEAPA